MKDYIKEINLEEADFICKLASNLNLDIQMFDGCLLDNFIIKDTEEIKLKINKKNIKARKYIIIKTKFANTWTSVYELILTDNEDFVKKCENKFKNN